MPFKGNSQGKSIGRGMRGGLGVCAYFFGGRYGGSLNHFGACFYIFAPVEEALYGRWLFLPLRFEIRLRRLPNLSAGRRVWLLAFGQYAKRSFLGVLFKRS